MWLGLYFFIQGCHFSSGIHSCRLLPSLINRTPTAVLHQKCPYHLLYQKNPLISESMVALLQKPQAYLQNYQSNTVPNYPIINNISYYHLSCKSPTSMNTFPITKLLSFLNGRSLCKMSTMEANNTWSVVLLPEDKYSIGCRWQCKGINNVFLCDPFKKIYMDLPLGYKCEGDNIACELHKSIYGLRQTSRQWFSSFQQLFLVKASLFTFGSGLNYVALLVYVDDIITGTMNPIVIKQVQQLDKTSSNSKPLATRITWHQNKLTPNKKYTYPKGNMYYQC
ncbi:hypothetical protein CR513_27629, partial [Mucuna pruriens]